jgi:formylglycine-generating enzyme required for sulfatase activity
VEQDSWAQATWRRLTLRHVLIGLVLLAGGVLGPVVALLVVDVPDTPGAAPFVTRTPSPPATALVPTATASERPLRSATPTVDVPASATPTPSVTWTPSPVPTSTPIAVPEGMVLIPTGYFLMGSALGPLSEAPEHPVLLDPFYIDRHEVSNADYHACVAAGACVPAGLARSFTRADYRDNPDYADYPVIGVTWDAARAYCQWAGKRLPSEAEWEYAASGPANFTWPWGNTFELARSAAGAPDTQPVDAYPVGASPFGVLNLGGNVTEWVEDVYVVGFYDVSPPRNPVGEGSGFFRLYRGGSFGNEDRSLYTTSHRSVKARNYSNVDVGFRCARSAPEVAQLLPLEVQQAIVSEFCALYGAYRPGAPCP